MINYKGLIMISLLLLFVLVSHCLQYNSVFGALKCIAKEREALLTFKQDLIDENGFLSSWGSEDAKKECCQWNGVKCRNETGHVIGLQLFGLRGKISNALLELNYLNDLGLSFNDFGYDKIPEFIGSLKNLQKLDLGYSNFSGVAPHQLGNLTNLRTLNLGGNELEFENLDWLSHLSSLSLLDLSHSFVRGTDLLQDVLKLPSLTELHLSYCQIPTYFFVNSPSTSLLILDLSGSGLTSSAYRWLFNISTSVRSIDLYNNALSAIPDGFERFANLEYLDLSWNGLTGGIPKSLGNLSHLQTLKLPWNSLSEPLSDLVYKLSVGAKNSLETLLLDTNEFHGLLPDFTLFSSLRILTLSQNQLSGSFPGSSGQLSSLEILDLTDNQIKSVPDLRAFVSLKELHLGGNKLSVLPASLWQLSMLELLDVSFNSLEGAISGADFSKLQSLKVLDLSFNSLFLNFTADWIPPFQLQSIILASCSMGTRFPTWLRTLKFSELDLSWVGISDEMPKWFWDLSPGMFYLNLSHNQISGRIPNLSSNLVNYPIIDISFNNFLGYLPLFSPNSLILQLSNNKFLGSISSICTNAYRRLWVLDLSNNQFSGELPNCWENMTELFILNLANNKLFGNIPRSLGSLTELQTLHLHDNNFSGELPSTLKNCQNLVMIDIGGNKISGNIPAWIGTHLEHLTVLSLGHNNFSGSIPPEICYLTQIQILDLSRNFISGRIPRCFNNFTSLVHKNRTIESTIPLIRFFVPGVPYGFISFIGHALVRWKGQEYEYKAILGLLRLIDLSSNRLVGNIPHEFAQMRALVSLNLSRNHLSGNIISNIGHMEMLECFDLSRNQFFGEIPIGIAELHFLAALDLSNNNLSGKIPKSAQLQGFDASVYAGNTELCGFPLRRCPGDGPNPPITNNEKQENADEEGFITHEFYISMVLGFIVGFWGVTGALVVKNSWRNAYFNSFNKIRDWLYVTTNIYVARLRGNLLANGLLPLVLLIWYTIEDASLWCSKNGRNLFSISKLSVVSSTNKSAVLGHLKFSLLF